MNTEKNIEEKIKAESEAFNNKIYDGDELPEELMFQFRQAMMKTAPGDPYWAKAIIKKSVDKLTWREAGIVINYIKKLPYEWFFEDLDEAVDYHIHLVELTEKYNEVMQELAAELENKKDRMYKLSGFSNNGNSRIIKN
jgi:hypothetical protein